MADGSGFDPCECIWSHESAMQRLLNMLRQSQSYCSDNVCQSDLPGPNAAQGVDPNMSLWMLMIGWIVLATALYMFRPNSMRRREDPSSDGKPSNGGNDGNNHEPPAIH